MRQQVGFIAGVTGIVLIAGTLSLLAQSPLAELAKKEEERRKAIGKPSKVITIEDARKYMPPPSPTPPPSTTGSSGTATPADQTTNPQAATDAQPAAAKAEPAAPADPLDEYRNHDEAWWRNRVSGLRSTLDQQRFFLNALIGQTTALTSELANPDANIRSTALTQLRATQDELGRVRGDVDKLTKSLADLEDAAARVGASSDWLR